MFIHIIRWRKSSFIVFLSPSFYFVSMLCPQSQRVLLWHQEVASFPFSFLMNSSWLLVFLFLIFYILFSGLHLKCWPTYRFSHYFYPIPWWLWVFIIILFHFWFRDLLREDYKKVEVFYVILFLVFLIFVFSEGINITKWFV